MNTALMLDLPEDPRRAGQYIAEAGIWAIKILAIPTLTLYYRIDDEKMEIEYLGIKQNWASG
ncbi:MAG TPA: hypothetical protein VK821_15220 [Dehalococcoidia bacterium]|nr:hypothetical protein [Dehalococcoidia bacterium]